MSFFVINFTTYYKVVHISLLRIDTEVSETRSLNANIITKFSMFKTALLLFQ